MSHARSVVRQVCRIAGQATLIDDLHDNAIATGLIDAVADHDTPRIFDWLIREASHQGISDAVADQYIDYHGNVTWAEIESALATNPTCAKLDGYWAFTTVDTTRDSRPAPTRISFPIARYLGIASATAG